MALFLFQDDDAPGADVASIRNKLLEVHHDYIKKLQDYDTMYDEHARISQVCWTYQYKGAAKISLLAHQKTDR